MTTKKEVVLGDYLGFDVRSLHGKNVGVFLTKVIDDVRREQVCKEKFMTSTKKQRTIERRWKIIAEKGLKPGVKVRYCDKELTIKHINANGQITFEKQRGTCGAPHLLEVVDTKSQSAREVGEK